MDLNKLQRQRRRIEGAKRAYMGQTRGLITRDRREVRWLQDEHEELSRSLRVSQSCSQRWNDATVLQDLSAKLSRGDRLDEELEAERRKVASLKDQILEWERKLTRQRSGGGTSYYSCKLDNSNFLRSTRLIENKLHRGNKCLNEQMIRNGELREELRTMQMEKNKFLHVKALLEKELRAIQNDIAKLMSKCTDAFSTSVKIQEKQRTLTDQNAKDVAQYTRETFNLKREISHYGRAVTFLDIKNIVWLSQDIDDRKGKGMRTPHDLISKHLPVPHYFESLNYTEYPSHQILTVQKSSHPAVSTELPLHVQFYPTAEMPKQQESREWRLEDFESALTKILTETEESDLDKLVRDFIQMEKLNYTLLNFINSQHNEAETIQRQISKLHREMKISATEGQQQQEQNRTQQQSVSNKQEAAAQQLRVYQQRVEFNEKLLDQLQEGLKSLLQICYDSSVVCAKLGSFDGINSENFQQCLSMVEDRVNELSSLQSYLHFDKNLSPWDTESLSTVAVKILGINPQAGKVTIGAAKTLACHDQDLAESVLLGAKEPMTKEALLSVAWKRVGETENVYSLK
ncbi:outer dynein arm-docking complex subunit 1-like [Leuresthes tenuis]|uniref:outer dynein arm-docking complex subunit 1-like n=1 Tax=Leuresthes tenuis TaxID=355514 RepID=UPI003B501841